MKKVGVVVFILLGFLLPASSEAGPPVQDPGTTNFMASGVLSVNLHDQIQTYEIFFNVPEGKRFVVENINYNCRIFDPEIDHLYSMQFLIPFGGNLIPYHLPIQEPRITSGSSATEYHYLYSEPAKFFVDGTAVANELKFELFVNPGSPGGGVIGTPDWHMELLDLKILLNGYLEPL